MMSYIEPVKIAVIGTGKVGASFAYAAILRGLPAEIVLVDKDLHRAEGEVMDLQQTVPFAHTVEIRAGSLLDAAGAAITVISAGMRPTAGQSPLDLLKHNAAVVKEIVPALTEVNPEGIILVATTPVDVLTYGVWRLSGLPRHQVIGAGTILETARLRYFLAKHFSVDPRSVHAYVLGENGESEVPVWSSATIAGLHIDEMCGANGCHPSSLDRIFEQVREEGRQINESKGSAYYAMGAALAELARRHHQGRKARVLRFNRAAETTRHGRGSPECAHSHREQRSGAHTQDRVGRR
jgi:L-lactate dehydrogenase